MVLIKAGLIRIVKGTVCFGLLAGVLFSFLLSYSYISGDHHDRKDMQRTFAKLGRKASFIQTAQADLASESEELLPPSKIGRSLSSVRSSDSN